MANLKQLSEAPERVSAGLPPAVGNAAGACVALLPSFAEARALVQAPYSCLVLDSHRRHVVLPPAFLRKKRTGIQQQLSAELLKYSKSLNGVPMAYDNIRVIGQHGDIFDDQGFIHLNIEASFVVFKPKKGEKLMGVINKVAVGHVGCLVHGCFNACVMKPAPLSPEQWRDSVLKVGGSLEFEVFQLDADVAGVLLIRGRLAKSRVQELVASYMNTGPEEQSESLAMESATETDSTEGTKKLKKKRTEKEVDREAVEDTNGNLTAEVESQERSSNLMELDHHFSSEHEEKKKKKKKKKDKRQEVMEELPSPTDLPNSDSSGYLSDKNSRKRKAQDSEVISDDSSMPVVKKKKKVK